MPAARRLVRCDAMRVSQSCCAISDPPPRRVAPI
jgi:hypothetical protein